MDDDDGCYQLVGDNFSSYHNYGYGSFVGIRATVSNLHSIYTISSQHWVDKLDLDHIPLDPLGSTSEIDPSLFNSVTSHNQSFKKKLA